MQGGLLDEVIRRQREWLEAKAESDCVTGQFVVIGPIRLGEDIPHPERVLDVNGAVEMRKAARNLAPRAPRGSPVARSRFWNSCQSSDKCLARVSLRVRP